MIVQAAGATSGEATIGQIELPADGPWIIHHVHGQIVRQTATPAESIGGNYRLSPPSGDLTPDPRPSNFPVFENGSFLGASAPVSNCPLNLQATNWTAEGKATIDLIGNQAIAATVAPIFVIGVVFGPQAPELRPAMFVDRVRSTIAAGAATLIGTIDLSEKATRITGIAGVLQQDGVLVTAEELVGHFFLTSDDVKLSPLQLPFNVVYGAGLGTVIGGRPQQPIPFIPVDIPVVNGTRLDCFVDLVTAVTNPADVEIFVRYE